MKKSQLASIAEQVGTSSSAVSKAINHCPGLSAELRDRILAAASLEGAYGRPPRSPCDVYVILPDTPTFFWRSFLRAVGEALHRSGLSAKYNVYTALGNRTAVERYLDEAERIAPAVLLIAAHYDGLAERLSDFAAHGMVLSLIEPIHATNVFFLGSDQRADGRMLGVRVRTERPDARHALVFVPTHTEERLAGFIEATEGLDSRIVRPLEGESAAGLARIVDAAHRERPLDVLICMNGNTQELCLALKKCRLELPCYGFETPPVDPRYPLPCGEVTQDIEQIAALAADMAVCFVREGVYPSQKYTYVASRYIQRRREG